MGQGFGFFVARYVQNSFATFEFTTLPRPPYSNRYLVQIFEVG
jgi:hypothetical protein